MEELFKKTIRIVSKIHNCRILFQLLMIKQTKRNVNGIMVIGAESEISGLSSSSGQVCCIDFSLMFFGKGMNLFFLSSPSGMN